MQRCRDPRLGQPHQPLHEGWRRSRASRRIQDRGGRGGSSSDPLPSGDSWGIASPVSKNCSIRVATLHSSEAYAALVPILGLGRRDAAGRCSRCGSLGALLARTSRAHRTGNLAASRRDHHATGAIRLGAVNFEIRTRPRGMLVPGCQPINSAYQFDLINSAAHERADRTRYWFIWYWFIWPSPAGMSCGRRLNAESSAPLPGA